MLWFFPQSLYKNILFQLENIHTPPKESRLNLQPFCKFQFSFTIVPLQDPVTWYGINYAGTQIMQWDLKTKELLPSSPTFLYFESPTTLFASQHNLFPTMWPDSAKGLFPLAFETSLEYLSTFQITFTEGISSLDQICQSTYLSDIDSRQIYSRSVVSQ